MKRLLAVQLLLWNLFQGSACAAVGTFTQWDVRSTGSDSNGGFFDPKVASPGTDESQSDAGTAITITLTGTTTGTGSPAFTSTTHGPGNAVIIASGSGCTTGRFEVLGQTAGVATFDHAMGSATNMCVGVIGGGTQTIGAVLSTMVASNTVNIKTGTYALTLTLLVPILNGLTNGSTAFIGYQTTHGDGGTKPLITSSTNSVRLFTMQGGGEWRFSNLSLSSTAATRGDGWHATGNVTDTVIDNCLLDGLNIGIDGNFAIDFEFIGLRVYNTEIKNSVSHAIQNSSNTQIDLCFLHDNGGDGFNAAGGQTFMDSITNTVAYKNAKGFDVPTDPGTNQTFEIINSVASDNTSDGIFIDNTGSSTGFALSVRNSILYNNGGFGVNLAGADVNGQIAQANAYGANTSGARNNFPAGTGDVTLTADPFVGRTSKNFALNSTAGGGAALKGVGFPGVVSFGTGFIDIGALQSQAPGGGGNSAYAQ